MFRLSLSRKIILGDTLQILVQLLELRRTYILNIQNYIEKLLKRSTHSYYGQNALLCRKAMFSLSLSMKIILGGSLQIRIPLAELRRT